MSNFLKYSFYHSYSAVFTRRAKSKTRKQTVAIPDSYIAKDMIEIGYGNIIPVWLFGFMY